MPEKRIVLKNCGVIDPRRITTYLDRDGFKAWQKVLAEMTPEQVIEEVKAKVVVDFDEQLDKEVCRDCGICIPFCPTGALSEPRKLSEEKQGKPLVITS